LLEKEVIQVLNKENQWNKYNTEKPDINLHDSLKKFKTELLKDSKTIDINQLKLDINFDQIFLKNKNFTIKDIKNYGSAKSNSSMKDIPVNNVFICIFVGK